MERFFILKQLILSAMLNLFYFIISIDTVLGYVNWSTDCIANLLIVDKNGNFGLICMIDWRLVGLSFLWTLFFLLISIVVILSFKHFFEKQLRFHLLKEKKKVHRFFCLEKKIQLLIVFIFIVIIWVSFYLLISSNFFSTISYKVLQWLSIRAYCTDEATSKKADSSQQNCDKDKKKSTPGKESRSSTKAPQSSTKEKKSSDKSTESGTKTETFSSSKASSSSSKEKASGSSKKNKPSKKEKTIDAVKQAEQVTKTQASKSSKERKQPSSSGRPVRPEDLRCDDQDKILAARLKKSKMLDEKRHQSKQEDVEYFSDLEEAKGASKNQVTQVEQGESSKVKTPKTKHIRNLKGDTASELGENFARIKKNSYIFD